MSLHSLANHLQSAGRGEDKVLVHMTPKEVNGLQSLAMAHGGSLTTNPETGLPEAGFLSSILPMVAGFALGPAGLGLTAMQAGLASAAIGTVATGSLKQGIMAGLGAYGGAGLGAGLMSQGAGAAAAPVGQNAAQTAITNAGNNAANFAGAGSNPFSSNALFNPAAGTGGGMTGFQAGVTNVAPTTSAVANTATTAAAAYPPGHPLYTPVQSQMNLASQSFTPSPATSGITPTSLAERQAILARTTPVDMADPNAFVTTNVPNQPITRPLLDDPGFTQYRDAAKLTPRPASPYMQPDRLAQYRGVDFAKGMEYTTPSASTAVDVSGQGISRPFTDRMSQVGRGLEKSFSSTEGLKGLYNAMPTGSVVASGLTLAEAMKPEEVKAQKEKSLIRPYDFDYGATGVASAPYEGSAERTYFNPVFTARTPYEAPGREYAASGGLMGFAVGGAVEGMAAQNAVGANTGYPMANLQTPIYSNPAMQRPEATNVIAPSVDAGVGSYSGEPRFASGGISHLGDYSDGGRLLKGPGDGVSDSIPASIGNRQPARLADGEFVVPARIVSEIGNGSTEAGARKLYAMMDRVQKARRKTVGKNQVARNTKAEKLLPA